MSVRAKAALGERDENHKAIEDAYITLYCNVYDTSRLGDGFPDLIVAVGTRRGKVLQLVEIKSKIGQLSPSQKRFARDFAEPVIVRSAAEVWAHVERVREANR